MPPRVGPAKFDKSKAESRRDGGFKVEGVRASSFQGVSFSRRPSCAFSRCDFSSCAFSSCDCSSCAFFKLCLFQVVTFQVVPYQVVTCEVVTCEVVIFPSCDFSKL